MLLKTNDIFPFPATSPRILPAGAALGPALVLLAVALLLRGWLFGNPVVHIDEQYYLLVGDRILQGDLPYVDLWDRKPVGLFLLYAGFAALGDGVIAYQVGATLAATATAFAIYRLALRVAPPSGALIAAVAYLIYLLPFNGAGGQSPVFYNLLVVLAASTTLALVGKPAGRGFVLKGCGVMLLLGLAIQVKYTVVFEGAYFGLALMWRCWQDQRSARAIVVLGALWIACALLPTAAAIAAYAALGHADAYIQANFLSIFGRHQSLPPALLRLIITTLMLTPFWLAIRQAPRPTTAIARETIPFVRGWAIAAIAGYLVFGSYYDHYALPLLMPLAILAAPGLGLPGRARRYTTILLTLGLVTGIGAVAWRAWTQGGRAGIERMTALIEPRLHGGCLYIFEGDPILYKTTRSCLSTNFIFPSHLNNWKEANALGVDPRQELRRILASGPPVIVLNDKPRQYLTNMETRAILLDALRRDYRFVAAVPVGDKTRLIYERVAPVTYTAPR